MEDFGINPGCEFATATVIGTRMIATFWTNTHWGHTCPITKRTLQLVQDRLSHECCRWRPRGAVLLEHDKRVAIVITVSIGHESARELVLREAQLDIVFAERQVLRGPIEKASSALVTISRNLEK